MRFQHTRAVRAMAKDGMRCPISCGDGWFVLIEAFFRSWGSLGISSVPLTEIKSSFGKVVFEGLSGRDFTGYVASDRIASLLDLIEWMSLRTCEICGGSAGLRRSRGVYKTLCRRHGKGWQPATSVDLGDAVMGYRRRIVPKTSAGREARP